MYMTYTIECSSMNWCWRLWQLRVDQPGVLSLLILVLIEHRMVLPSLQLIRMNLYKQVTAVFVVMS